jgi:hypothetical protein
MIRSHQRTGKWILFWMIHGIKQHNKKKKLSKTEQTSLNQDQESDSRCFTSVTEISTRGSCQNSSTFLLLGPKGTFSLAQLFDKVTDAKSSAIYTN